MKLEQVTFSFGGAPVLHNFSLYIPKTGLYCLLAPSGSGKTTLFRLMAGLLTPQAGKVDWQGIQRPALLFQEDRLLPWLTALQNAALAAGEGEAQAWLVRLGLGEALMKYPAELSGGMRRRVALARALAFKGDILLLDEPFKGMDEQLIDICLHIFKEISASIPVLMVTHSPEQARLADEIFTFTGPPLAYAQP